MLRFRRARISGVRSHRSGRNWGFLPEGAKQRPFHIWTSLQAGRSRAQTLH
jgi:hypothetical protein